MRKCCGRIVGLMLLTVLSACGDDDDRRAATPTPTLTSTSTPIPRETSDPTETAVTTTTPTPVETVIASTVTISATPTSTATPIDVARFVGVYDDSSGRPRPGLDVPAVATLTGTAEALTVAIFFDGHTTVGLQGSARADGTALLSGG